MLQGGRGRPRSFKNCTPQAADQLGSRTKDEDEHEDDSKGSSASRLPFGGRRSSPRQPHTELTSSSLNLHLHHVTQDSLAFDRRAYRRNSLCSCHSSLH